MQCVDAHSSDSADGRLECAPFVRGCRGCGFGVWGLGHGWGWAGWLDEAPAGAVFWVVVMVDRSI